MYKPPQNSNRVKSIKSKFESIDNIENKEPQKNNLRQNGFRNNLNFSPSKRADNLVTQNNISTKNIKLPESPPKNEKSLLQRQMSDPCKRNIKRTPAFRVDKSLERTNEFQRNSFDRSTLFETKVKQFSAVKNNCDTNSNLVVSEVCEKKVVKVPKKPLLVKSKSSLDFEYIRSKFDKKSNNNTSVNNENPSKSDKLNDVDLSLLYTEPIPKSLRNKNINEVINHVNIEPLPQNDIYNCSTLKVSDKPLFSNLQYEGLTDTLKAALKKPLPPGPAPKKPPRTFEHSSVENVGKNVSFLHLSKLVEKNLKAKVISPPKKDPKYMLSKLENAVRNKKLRVRQQPKIDISTSGEDSDDSLLFRSKTNKIEHCSDNRTLPRLPSQGENCSNSTFNLNCLNSLSCSISNYEKIKEPSSCFFVGSFEEPVYAEPFHFAKDPELVLRNMEGSTRSKDTTKSARNSLYYMSTPVLNEISRYPGDMNGSTHDQDDIKLPDLQLTGNLLRRPSAENSSLSSFTSDLDSTPSPMEESATVQSILQCFEAKSVADNGCHIDSTNRVENLKNCIRSTLERSFAPDSAIFRDSDSENNEEGKLWDIIRKFENYRQTMPKYCKPKVHNDTLFYCCLIIDKFKDVVQIKYKYPSCVDIPQNLESLCFPENDSALLYSTNTAQSYSLLITNDKGERMFGYCRRVLPEGCTRSLPLAYCILSKYRAPRFYKKILHEIESRHGIPTKYRDELICQFYHQKFPKPGDSIKINLNNIEPQAIKTDPGFEDSVDLQNYVLINKTGEHLNIKGNSERLEKIFVSDNDVKMSCTTPSYILENEGRRELILTLHPDTRYEDADLKLLHQLPDDVLLKIFSSLLLERRVILISSSIGVLSSCVDSLQSILYPFIWHHTFIPILPQQLWDIVESPTPVICGVLSKQVVEDHQIENGIVVDLDSRTVLKEEGDENKILSASMQKVWRRNIALANRATASKEYVHSVFLSDAYLQVFILCFKDYKKYFVDGNFMKEEFLKKKTKGVKRFLKMFTETYMFLAFLDTAVTNDENLAEFHKKIEMYGSNESDIILDKLLGWNK